MSWITRWGIKNMQKWGGWHSLEDRENYLLSQIEYLQNEINNLKIKNKILDENFKKTREIALGAVIEYFQQNVIVQHYDNYSIASKKEKHDE